MIKILSIVAFILAIVLFVLIKPMQPQLKLPHLKLDYLLALLSLLFWGYQIGLIFYNDTHYAVMTAGCFSYGMRYYHKWKLKRKSAQLKEEFLELNRMLISELHAGKSLEMAYREIYYRLANDSRNYQPNMQAELKQWCKKMDMGITLPEIMNDFAERCNDDHITQFVNMLEVAKSSGSSLLDVINFTDRMIGEGVQIERELSVLIAEKKLEQVVMSVAPILLLYVMQQFSYDFVSPLYETAIGRLLMTIALSVFAGCFLWSKRMTEIDI